MKFESFKAGRWQQRSQYKSFKPEPVNLEWTCEHPTINTLLESANRALGELNAFSLIVPNIDLLIQMYVAKEAQTSSRIEGTQTLAIDHHHPLCTLAPRGLSDPGAPYFAGEKLPSIQHTAAIVYVLRSGCQWKALPRESGRASVVHLHFQKWQQAGFFLRLWRNRRNAISPWDSVSGMIPNRSQAARMRGRSRGRTPVSPSG